MQYDAFLNLVILTNKLIKMVKLPATRQVERKTYHSHGSTHTHKESGNDAMSLV